MISVVVPVYNGERFIADTLRSVRCQSYAASEVIVVDDGSTDSTEEIVRTEFPEVRYHRQPNAGAAAARNAGTSRATNDWIAFLDADDLWYRDKLSVQREEIAVHPEVGLVYSNVDRIDASGAVVQ